MVRKLSKLFTTFWPFGLLAFFVLVILSFTKATPHDAAQVFGIAVIAIGAMAWLLTDYVGGSDNRVQSKLKELEDVLKPYEGMKLREMPIEVQEAVRAKLGWRETPDQSKQAESKQPDKAS